ncbi:hypothetical protein [Bradyrhizobium lablabi]|uniref:hypothetical protein n=1 Tax=Bradyrhizobium lablabi TaxID=722472 RepID=UPI001BACBC72|nr:hypothetical protein [Bradyrhizobium lablabi]MBR0693474.1 hypothetical protein [Bradyrhizobium lablabi]
MGNRIDFEGIVVAICVAAYVAIMLVHVARDDLGFSGAQIRHLSMVGAVVLAIPLAMDLLRTGPDKTG